MIRPIYRFGAFSIDLPARELRRSGTLLTVSPKVFDCIAYLIEHRDRAVGRDELIAAVWGRADIADAQLRHLIRKARHAIGTGSTSQAMIRTLPRFGFHWVAEVLSTEVPTPDLRLSSGAPLISVSEEPKSDARPFAALNGLRLASFALVGVIALACSAYLMKSVFTANNSGIETSAPSATSQRLTNGIAVLPAETTGTGLDDDWMRLGLMDFVANRLREASLVVVPSSDIVTLSSNRSDGETLSDKVRAVIGVQDVVVPVIARENDGWTLRLELVGRDGIRRSAESHSSDPILAAHDASRRLLDMLGKPPQPAYIDKAMPKTAALRQRVEAALLAGDAAAALKIFGEAPAELQETDEAQVLMARAEIANGDFAKVRARLEPLLERVSAETNPILRAEVFNELGAAERQSGQWDLARQRFDDSIRLLDNLNEPYALGRAHAGRAAIGALQGRFDDAQKDFSEARVAFELAGDSLALARVDMNEGGLEAFRNHPAQALAFFEQAAQRFDQFGDQSWLVNALGNAISAQLDLLQPAAAFATSERMSGQLTHMGTTVHAHVAKLQQVEALLRSGHLRAAQELLDDLERSIDPRSEKALLGTVRELEAEVDFNAGRWQAALDHAEFATTELTAGEYDGERSSAWLIRIRALAALQRDTEAASEVQKFSTWANEQESPTKLLHARLADAELARVQNRRQAAYELYEIALHIAREIGVPASIADVAVSYGNALIDTGELERAVTVVGQVAPWADSDFECALLQAKLYHALGRRESWRLAIEQARSLAGERPLPADVSAPPADRISMIEGH
jgi:DNA-binding winged helix-turn-helix (wHTH) protein/tetratricopeptide (TPR) repeat protein